MAEQDPWLDDFKSHIEWESDMDDNMLSHYLSYARQFVKTATGKQTEQMVLMVAALLNDFRVSEKDLASGLDSLTPFFLNEVFTDDTNDEQA